MDNTVLEKQNNSFRITIKKAIDRLCVLFPLQNAIVFECENDMDDNPRAFYEYLVEHKYHEKYRMVWIVKDVEFCKKRYSRIHVDFVSRLDRSLLNRLKLRYYLSTSKWFIFSHPWWFVKLRKEQTIIHVGHGTPIKQTGKGNSRECFDYMLVPTEDVKDWYLKFWHCDKDKTFICGLPRNDLLEKGNGKREEILAKLISGYCNEKVIMCMPTFRQSEYILDSDVIDRFGMGVVDTQEQFDCLNEYLKSQSIHLIIKPHPLQKKEYIQVTGASNIHYWQNADLLRKNIMLYELLGCCDALLSDVSSVVFDYLLLNRPLGFFMSNFNSYSRGYLLEDPTEYMPGEHIYSFEELMMFIQQFSQGIDSYEEERLRVNEYVNGRNTKDRCFNEELANWMWKDFCSERMAE